MAIVELVFLNFLKDPVLLKEAEKKFIPPLVKNLQQAGVLNGIRGFFVSQDGKDVSADVKEIAVFEWPTAAAFHAFATGKIYAAFRADLKPYVAGPAELRLFEANIGTESFGANTVLEILVCHPLGGDDDAQTVLDKVAKGVKTSRDDSVVYGMSLNLEKKQIVVVESFADKAAYGLVKEAPSRLAFVEDIRQIATVTQLVADYEKAPF